MAHAPGNPRPEQLRGRPPLVLNRITEPAELAEEWTILLGHAELRSQTPNTCHTVVPVSYTLRDTQQMGGHMRIINQPYDGQLGDMLIGKLRSGEYASLAIVVAFAKVSGVLRIKSAVEEFRNRGGAVTAFVGIDLNGTSYEALIALFHLCNELYVVHTESSTQTFHPKMYDLSNVDTAWTVVGSNNLTAGGLWGNFESFACNEFDFSSEDDVQTHSALEAHFTRLSDEHSLESLKMVSEIDVHALLDHGYIQREITTRLALGTHSGREPIERKLFAASVPAAAPTLPKSTATRDRSHGVAPATADDSSIKPWGSSPANKEDATREVIWLETRAMTGGSGNQLDLSMKGKIISGSAHGTRFETGDNRTMRGTVFFFDVDPEATDLVEHVTVNLDGVDYHPCTIKMHHEGKRPNGSWRMQLEGISAVTGKTLADTMGQDFFKHKIVAFEAIAPRYFALTVFPEAELETFKNASSVVARNGGGGNTKFYGLL